MSLSALILALIYRKALIILFVAYLSDVSNLENGYHDEERSRCMSHSKSVLIYGIHLRHVHPASNPIGNRQARLNRCANLGIYRWLRVPITYFKLNNVPRVRKETCML